MRFSAKEYTEGQAARAEAMRKGFAPGGSDASDGLIILAVIAGFLIAVFFVWGKKSKGSSGRKYPQS